MNLTVDNLKVNIGNPARAYSWEVIMPRVPGLDDPETMTLRCQSAELPGRGVNTIHLPFRGSAGVNYPGRVNFGDQRWSVSFVEGEDSRTHDALYNWSELVAAARTGVSNVPVQSLKVPIRVRLLSDRTNQAYNDIVIVGAFLQDVPKIQLSNDRDALIQFNATVVYDYWEKATAVVLNAAFGVGMIR